MAEMKSIAIAVAPNAPATAKANSSTGAFSHTDAGWHDINWRKAHQNVRRLQVRIVKATQDVKPRIPEYV